MSTSGERDLIQPSFSAGELSPAVYARIDIAKHAVGLKTARNFIILVQGGAANRPGTEFAGRTKVQTKRVRLIPFAFSRTQTYIIEFGHQYIRFQTGGGYVVEAAKNITAISRHNPGVVTSAAHGYSNGDWVYVADVAGMDEVNGRFFIVANKTTDTFELTDLDAAAVDTTGYTAYTSAGTCQRVYTLVTTYTEDDLRNIRYAQSKDVITLTVTGFSQAKLTRVANASWTLANITFAPSIAAPTSPSAVATLTGSTTYDYKVTSVSENGEESLPTSSATCTNDLTTAGHYNTVSWTAESAAVTYNVYRKKNGIWGYVGSAAGTSFIDDNIDPDVAFSAPRARDPFSGGTSDKPEAVTYHEQRIVYAGSVNNPEVLWGSQIAAHTNMCAASPARDSDAFTFRLQDTAQNTIQHLVSLTNLLVFTEGAEHVIKAGSTNDALGPNSFDNKKHTEFGCCGVPPIIAGDVVLFVAAGQRQVYEFIFDYSVDKYVGNNRTLLAAHLFEQYGIVEWAYAPRPFGVIWAIREDGTLLSFTYNRSQDVWGWATHDTDGFYESVAVVDEDGQSVPYFAVRRYIDGLTAYRRYVERMHSRDFVRVEDGYFVDCGLSYNGWNTDDTITVTPSGGTNWTVDETVVLTANHAIFAATDVGRTLALRISDTALNTVAFCRFTVTSYTSTTVVHATPDVLVPELLRSVGAYEWGFAYAALAGFGHIEGKTVSILGDGDVHVQKTVTDGEVAFDRAVVVAQVGVPYTSDLETLDIGGTPTAPLSGRRKSVASVTLLVSRSRGIFAGPDADHLQEYRQRSNEDFNQPTNLLTGNAEVVIVPTWNSNGRVLLRQSDPLPLQVNGVLLSFDNS